MEAVVDAPGPVTMTPDAAALPRALARRLTTLADVVDAMDGCAYVRVPDGGFSGSTGAHVRHAIDHVAALLDRRHGEDVNYAARRRGTRVETDRDVAVTELRRLADAVVRVPSGALSAGLCVRDVVERDTEATPLSSTLARELAFVLHHLVHHEALIAFIQAGVAGGVPAGFGVAASTPLPAR